MGSPPSLARILVREGAPFAFVASVLARSPLTFPMGPSRSRGTETAASRSKEVKTMLYYAAVFFVIALIAALFGFGGIAVGAAGIAKVLFVVFLVVAVLSLLLGRRSTL
jgi:uncharacterized membrane protein YtjA (UPF0391 family)